MEQANPTINQALEAFLGEQKQRLATKTYAKYEAVIHLLGDCLDSYGHLSLSAREGKVWHKAFMQDEEAGAFCNMFGPDKIPENVGEFLGYFMIRKVMAGQDLLKASGTVVRKLLKWLRAEDLIEAADAQDGLEIVDDIGPDLAISDEFSFRLGSLCLEQPTGRVLEEWEDAYAGIAKVEQGKIWFSNHSASEVVGPVLVSKETSDIAKVGWDVSAVYLVRTGKGWHMSGVGTVYP